MFEHVTETILTNAHGEVNFLLIKEGGVDTSELTPVEAENGAFVVGHSEEGHHHVLEAEGVTVKERELDGMKVFYAILEKPAALRQEAGTPHAPQTVQPGKYIITNNREFNPFLQQARRVAD